MHHDLSLIDLQKRVEIFAFVFSFLVLLTRVSSNPNACSSITCENGGSCIERVGKDHKKPFKCKCDLGYYGERCELNAPQCGSNPCINGGVCMGTTRGYRCECPPGYGGKICADDQVKVQKKINNKTEETTDEEKTDEENTDEKKTFSKRLMTFLVLSGIVAVVLLFAFCGKVQEERNTLLEMTPSDIALGIRGGTPRKTDICSVSFHVAFKLLKSCIKTVDSNDPTSIRIARGGQGSIHSALNEGYVDTPARSSTLRINPPLRQLSSRVGSNHPRASACPSYGSNRRVTDIHNSILSEIMSRQSLRQNDGKPIK